MRIASVAAIVGLSIACNGGAVVPTASPTEAPIPTATAAAAPTAAATPTATPTATTTPPPAPTATPAPPPHLTLPGWDSTLTPDQAAALAIFPARLRAAFYAIGCAETGWLLTAVGDTTLPTGPAYGWAQIERPWFDGAAYPSVPAFPDAWKTSAVGSARGALIIFDHQGLDAWSTWKAGGRTAEGTLAWARAHRNCLVE